MIPTGLGKYDLASILPMRILADQSTEDGLISRMPTLGTVGMHKMMLQPGANFIKHPRHLRTGFASRHSLHAELQLGGLDVGSERAVDSRDTMFIPCFELLKCRHH
jgi:hypothetical protein